MMGRPLEHWDPGWEGMLNGERVRCVTGSNVPARVWEQLGRNNNWVVGTFSMLSKVWLRADAIPHHWDLAGSCIRGDAYTSTLIPVTLLDPQENEWGPVMP